jgi:hypothetical protein
MPRILQLQVSASEDKTALKWGIWENAYYWYMKGLGFANISNLQFIEGQRPHQSAHRIVWYAFCVPAQIFGGSFTWSQIDWLIHSFIPSWTTLAPSRFRDIPRDVAYVIQWLRRREMSTVKEYFSLRRQLLYIVNEIPLGNANFFCWARKVHST